MPVIGFFNDRVGIDILFIKDVKGEIFQMLSIVDLSIVFHIVARLGSRAPQEVWKLLSDRWLSWAGPMRQLYVDDDGAFEGEFTDKCEEHGIERTVCAGEAHWQLGIAEVSIKLVKTTMDKLARAHPTRPVKEILARSLAALNAQELVRGYSPIQHALDGRPQRDGEFQPEDSPVIADLPEHEHSRMLRRDAETAAI